MNDQNALDQIIEVSDVWNKESLLQLYLDNKIPSDQFIVHDIYVRENANFL